MNQIKQLLIAVLDKMNLWEQNAKSIDELPASSSVVPTAKIHVSEGGTSKSLELQKLINAALGFSINQITSIGEITVDGNDVITPPATWKIANVSYSTSTNTFTNHPFSSTGTTRIDILVANASNQIIKISGTNTTGIAIRPNIPLNTVLITEINVSEDSLTAVPFPLNTNQIQAIQGANTPSASNPFATLLDLISGTSLVPYVELNPERDFEIADLSRLLLPTLSGSSSYGVYAIPLDVFSLGNRIEVLVQFDESFTTVLVIPTGVNVIFNGATITDDYRFIPKGTKAILINIGGNNWVMTYEVSGNSASQNFQDVTTGAGNNVTTNDVSVKSVTVTGDDAPNGFKVTYEGGNFLIYDANNVVCLAIPLASFQMIIGDIFTSSLVLNANNITGQKTATFPDRDIMVAGTDEIPELPFTWVSNEVDFIEKIIYASQLRLRNPTGNLGVFEIDSLTQNRTIPFQNIDYTAVADIQDVIKAIDDLKDGVASPGDTLQKLYNLILGASAEDYVANITARDAYNIPHLPFSIFVIDDGDGRWAKYQATTTGVGATFVKLSDPDLLNAVMNAAAIKAAYESNSDTNAFTNALKSKLDSITAIFTTALKNSYDAVVTGYTALIATGQRLITTTEISKLGAIFNYKNAVGTTSVTGTTIETQVLQYQIIGNSFSTTDIANLFLTALKTNGATPGTATIRVKLSTSSTMPSGTTGQIATYLITSGNRFGKIQRGFDIRGGNILGFPFTTSAISDITTTNAALSSLAFDTTSNIYLYVSIQNSDAGDSTLFSSIQFTNQ